MERKPALSVCLIVRNEAGRLPRALGSLRGLPHETVVVDTGSDDGTPAVARSLGARVIQIPWADDFAAARNAAIAAASGDWILSIDADEEMMPGQSSELQRCLNAQGADAWNVLLRSPLSGVQEGMEFQHRFPRLFRNRMGIRFAGRVHEQLGASLHAAGARVLESNLVLLHSGYDIDARSRKRKLERNLRLLQMDHAERPNDGYLHFHLGETWAGLGRPDEAARWYERALDAGGLDSAHCAAVHQNLAGVLLQQGRLRDAAAAALCALRADRDALPAWLHLAGARIRMGEYERGMRSARMYLRRAQKVSSERRRLGFAPDPARAWLILGEACLRQGRTDEAAAASEQVCSLRADWAPGERLAGRVAVAEGRIAEAAGHLRRAAGLEPDAAPGWCEWVRVLVAAGDFASASVAAEEALTHVQDPALYHVQAWLRLQARDWAGAAVSYEQLVRLGAGATEAHRKLAGLYQKLGESGRARHHLECLQRAATKDAARCS